LWEETPTTRRQIAADYGVSEDTLYRLFRRRGWVSFNPQKPPRKRTPGEEEAIRQEWEETRSTASEIGAKHGIAKCGVIGLARRRGWVRFGSERQRTTFDRCDAWDAYMDRVLRETEWRPEHGLGCPAVRF
jgi:hypothetical protein